MIEVLRIENLALVESVELEFGAGLNVLTGETGAGKSIILSALALLTGARASGDTLRAGAEEGAVEALFRIEDTAALRLDVGRGLRDVALRQIGEEEILGAPPPLISGDIKVRALGWQADGTKPLWRIEQSVPLPFTLLSVTTELKLND